MEKTGNWSDGKEMVMNMRGLSRCLVFSGKDEDYENWRVLVDDWIEIDGKRGSILVLSCGEELKANGEVKMILQELEKHNKKEGKVHMMSKVKSYYQIQRGK